MASNTLRRAPLFIPGDDMHKIRKGLTLPADSLILELEDGVAVSQKEKARQIVVEVLKTLDFGRKERLVRLNAWNTPFAAEDLAATLPTRPNGYVIPKVESGETIRQISAQIAQFEQRHSWPLEGIRLLAIIETALGVVNLTKIASATSRLDALIFGAEDLAGDIGATRTAAGWEVFYAKSAVVTTAAAFGLEAIDTPYFALHDFEGLKSEAEQARNFGYSGKLAIHPKQLAPLHQVFSPSEEEVAAARRLVDAHHAHQAQGSGVFTLDDKMVDMPVIRAAEKILNKAKVIYDSKQ